MSGRRRAGLGIAGVLVLAVGAALVWGLVIKGRHADRAKATVVYTEATPTATLIEGLREGDARALLILFPRMAVAPGTAPKAVTPQLGEEMVKTLSSLRTGFLRFGSYGRASALKLVTVILERLAVEPAPSGWARSIQPVHDLFASGLADGDLQTRIVALTEIGKFWSWFPGRAMLPVEEKALYERKTALFAPVVRRLGDREPQARVAAVACLGNLPDDQAAAPAIAYLEDRSDGAGPVRKQVLASFARRPSLLTEDLILKRLRDPEPGVPEMAELILSTRGLTHEQIDLGRLIFDPKPEHRASVIPRLRGRTDIDPVVWLIQLSQDESEVVRTGAAEALAERQTPEVKQRLAEMARSDRSPAVREAVRKLLFPASKAETATSIPLPRTGQNPPAPADNASETTVALPPLPGSPSLNPRAN